MNYNIYQLIIHDFAFIPIKLRQEKRFCLWKYQKSNSSIAKPLKKSYELDSINRVTPSLKDKSLQKLYKVFFIEYSNNRFHSFIKNPLPKQTCFEFNIDQKILDQQYVLIRQKILHSNLSKIYYDLCILTNPGYLSPSEADWSYFLLILGFLKLDQTYAEKYCLLKYFYQKDRPKRSKKTGKII